MIAANRAALHVTGKSGTVFRLFDMHKLNS